MKRLSNIYYLLFGILLITYYLINNTSVTLAQSPTPTASPRSSVSPSPTASASPSNGKAIRDNLRERVEEKLSQLSKKPRSYVGKITQIPNSSLTLETKSGVKQVKVTPQTTILQITGGKQKTIKESDFVVGNFVVAMGHIENKDTLAAQRILTMTENPLRVRQPVYGVVQSTEKGTFTVKHPKKDGSTSSPQDETWTVKTSAKTRVTAKVDGKMEKTNASSIAVDDRIIAVGEPVKNTPNTITAKLIHVIPGKARGLTKPSPSPTKPTSTPKPSPAP